MFFPMPSNTSDTELQKILDKLQKLIKASQIPASYFDNTGKYHKNQRRDLFKIERPHKYKFSNFKGHNIAKLKTIPKIEDYHDFESFYEIKRAKIVSF